MNTTDALFKLRGTPGMNLLVMSTWALGLLWSILMPLRFVSPTASRDDITPFVSFFLAIACGLLAWAGSVFAQSMGAGARVLGQRQVPTRLWRRWLRAGLNKTLVHSGFLAFAVVTLSLPKPAPWSGFTAAAMVSLVMSVSVARGLAVQGLVPRGWAWAAPVLVSLLLVGSSLGGGFTSALRWIDSGPWIVLLCAAASWPVLAWVISQRWLKGIPALRTGGVGLHGGLWARAKKLARRYTPLTLFTMGAQSARHADRLTGFQTMFGPAVSLFSAFGPLLAHPVLGQSALVRIGILLMLVFIVSAALVCKDLHWRMLLAPGGMRCGRLGWHIAVSSATAYFLGLLIFGAVVVGAVSLVFPVTLDGLMVFFMRFFAFPLELVFAVSVGTLIRGTTYPKRWYDGLKVVLILVLVGLALLLFLLPSGGLRGDSFLAIALEPRTFGSGYMLTLAVLSALALLCANRLWTVDKLLQCAPK